MLAGVSSSNNASAQRVISQPVLFGQVPIIKTTQDYRLLTEADRVEFQQVGPPYTKYIHQTKVVNPLIKLAQEFTTQYPDDQYAFFGLGRSPLFFLEVAKAMKSGISDYTAISCTGLSSLNYGLTREHNVLDHLGKIMAEDPGGFETLLSAQNNKDTRAFLQKTRNSLLNFKKYLKVKQMNPESIVQRATDGKKTVVVDGVSLGTTIAMFAEFMDLWAKELGLDDALKKALVFHGYSPWGGGDCSQISDRGYQYNLVQASKPDDPVSAFGYPMNSDSYGLGTTLYIENAPDPSVSLKHEVEVTHSETANCVRYHIMSQLDQAGILKFGAWLRKATATA